MNEATAVFSALRPRLHGIAYRMLGSVAESEDVVQDIWLSWNGVEHHTVENPEAWLVAATTRRAIDRLRAAKARREDYVGIWLPEPILTDEGASPEELQELASDVTALVRETDPKGELPVMLIGYSFGADTLPFAWPLLPKTLQDRTKVIALMAPGLSTSFQVTISGWLGISDSGYDIPQAIAALPVDRVICVSGKDEDQSACRDPALRTFTHIETDGGHHFDGNYTAIAQKFLDKL